MGGYRTHVGPIGGRSGESLENVERAGLSIQVDSTSDAAMVERGGAKLSTLIRYLSCYSRAPFKGCCVRTPTKCQTLDRLRT